MKIPATWNAVPALSGGNKPLAILMLSVLEGARDEPVNYPALSQVLGVPESTLRKVIGALARSGVIRVSYGHRQVDGRIRRNMPLVTFEGQWDGVSDVVTPDQGKGEKDAEKKRARKEKKTEFEAKIDQIFEAWWKVFPNPIAFQRAKVREEFRKMFPAGRRPEVLAERWKALYAHTAEYGRRVEEENTPKKFLKWPLNFLREFDVSAAAEQMPEEREEYVMETPDGDVPLARGTQKHLEKTGAKGGTGR